MNQQRRRAHFRARHYPQPALDTQPIPNYLDEITAIRTPDHQEIHRAIIELDMPPVKEFARYRLPSPEWWLIFVCVFWDAGMLVDWCDQRGRWHHLPEDQKP